MAGGHGERPPHTSPTQSKAKTARTCSSLDWTPGASSSPAGRMSGKSSRPPSQNERAFVALAQSEAWRAGTARSTLGFPLVMSSSCNDHFHRAHVSPVIAHLRAAHRRPLPPLPRFECHISSLPSSTCRTRRVANAGDYFGPRAVTDGVPRVGLEIGVHVVTRSRSSRRVVRLAGLRWGSRTATGRVAAPGTKPGM